MTKKVVKKYWQVYLSYPIIMTKIFVKYLKTKSNYMINIFCRLLITSKLVEKEEGHATIEQVERI